MKQKNIECIKADACFNPTQPRESGFLSVSELRPVQRSEAVEFWKPKGWPKRFGNDKKSQGAGADKEPR